MRVHETTYRDWLDFGIAVDVRFITSKSGVTDYVVVLLGRAHGQLRAVRVYDNVHRVNDMHRYNQAGEKQPAEAFHDGSASEALQSALSMVRDGYREMIESWRR